MTKARSNATANAAKGDLTVGNGTNLSGILAVGSNGDTIVADSSTATGLKWAAPAAGGDTFAAGKNKIINGDFRFNQRAFTSNTTTGTYGFDRFKQANSGGTFTVTPQTFTLGAAPVSGYEGTNYCRLVTATQSAAGDYAALEQMVESVRTFAGQTVTFSCWAKASTGTPLIGFSVLQQFGTGGSPSSNVITSGGTTAITSSWARYSFTVTIPSISGKTIGTNDNDKLQVDLWTSVGTTISGLGYPAVGIQNVTIETWGWQLEAGSTATDFQTATGTIQGELAACQRYYYRAGTNDSATFGALTSLGFLDSTTVTVSFAVFPVVMRVAPTSIDYPTLSGIRSYGYQGAQALSALTLSSTKTSANIGYMNGTHAAMTLGAGGQYFEKNNTTGAYIGFSAEL